jgi:hypothetical protein
MAAIEAEINKLERKKPKQPQRAKPGGKENQPVAGGQEQDAGKPDSSANSDGGAGKEKPEPPKVTVQCDKLTALVSSVQRRISSGRVNPDGLIADLAATEAGALKEGNCAAEVFADGSKSRTRLGKIATLRQKITAAISTCNIDSISSLKAETRRVSRSFFASEVSLLETMKTAVSTFKTGRASYDADKYRPISIAYETPGRELIQNGATGEILGVRAEQGDKSIYVKARKAVVLTCGGFENNQEMIRNYLPGLPYCYTAGTPHNEGDGITMALAVGADLWHMNNYAGPSMALKVPEIPTPFSMQALHFSKVFPGGMIVVGPDGTRFGDEKLKTRHGKDSNEWLMAPPSAAMPHVHGVRSRDDGCRPVVQQAS